MSEIIIKKSNNKNINSFEILCEKQIVQELNQIFDEIKDKIPSSIAKEDARVDPGPFQKIIVEKLENYILYIISMDQMQTDRLADKIIKFCSQKCFNAAMSRFEKTKEELNTIHSNKEKNRINGTINGEFTLYCDHNPLKGSYLDPTLLKGKKAAWKWFDELLNRMTFQPITWSQDSHRTIRGLAAHIVTRVCSKTKLYHPRDEPIPSSPVKKKRPRYELPAESTKIASPASTEEKKEEALPEESENP